MKSYSFNFIKVDLRIINTLENCKRLLSENNISSEKVDASKLFDLKYTLDFVFFDQETFTIVAYIQKREKQIEFVRDLHSEMYDIIPIKYIKRDKTGESQNMKLDEILDKISKSGINGLTQYEKDFLDNQSKK